MATDPEMQARMSEAIRPLGESLERYAEAMKRAQATFDRMLDEMLWGAARQMMDSREMQHFLVVTAKGRKIARGPWRARYRRDTFMVRKFRR